MLVLFTLARCFSIWGFSSILNGELSRAWPDQVITTTYQCCRKSHTQHWNISLDFSSTAHRKRRTLELVKLD